ncbi:hypothetical protein RJ639_034157 [Escallonia herrerae]|uniref:Uncharacterized protein n=1 Tax=Escallonia herrerae TaxID=1293975 RepID=A0AA88X2V0_9ASTE|nr:hypothetical protein RJ639_034157 [Escallonia herrerae]
MFNCGKKGHFARDYSFKKRSVEGNVATSTDHEEGVNSKEEWDAQALVCERIDEEQEEEIDFDQRDLEDLNSSHKITENNIKEQALAATFPEEVDYNHDWIVDSGCSNHMTGDKENLKSMSEYKGDLVVVTADNSRYEEKLGLSIPVNIFKKLRGVWSGRCQIFDEASSWWSPQEVVLPDTHEIKERMGERIAVEEDAEQPSTKSTIKLRPKILRAVEEPDSTQERLEGPWQTGAYYRTPEETRPDQHDDIQNEEDEIHRTKENLSVRFQMKELGELNHFLGLEVDHTREALFLCQQKYAIDLLQRFGMLECKPMLTPMEPNVKFCAVEGKDLVDSSMYRQLVGSLIYLTWTRPDIAYAVGIVSRFMQIPKKPHLKMVWRIIRNRQQRADLNSMLVLRSMPPFECAEKETEEKSGRPQRKVKKHGVSDAITCLAFLTTLQKASNTCFKSLPPISIHSFSKLSDLFQKHLGLAEEKNHEYGKRALEDNGLEVDMKNLMPSNEHWSQNPTN